MISPEEMKAIEELLPFYVNGTISNANRARVDAALAESAALREALQQEHALKEHVVDGVNASIEQSDEVLAAREALLVARTKVASQPLAAIGSNSQPSGMMKALAFLNPKRWHPAVSLGLAATITAQAGIIAGQSGTIAALEEENYRLASGPCEDEQKAGRFLIEVKDGTPYEALASLLEKEGLTISKSGDFGVLTLQSDKKGEELSAQLDRLRKSPLISSAEPAA
jgi:hypothetical protein